MHDGVCVAVIDNPTQSNALNTAVMSRLLEVFAVVRSDAEIRVLVLTGAGRHFCAGADIGLLTGLDSLADTKAYIASIRDVYLALEGLAKPTIAAVNGYALGGGLELCLACDLIIASDQAAFGLPEVLLGVLPGFALVRLPQLVGLHKAAEMMMLGDRISARDAAQIGLVNRVVPADSLMDEAQALAVRLAAGAPLALEAIKTTMRGSSTGVDMILFLNTAASVLTTSDARRGTQAFARKQTAAFEGR